MSTSGMSQTNIMDRSRVSSTAGSDATRRAYLAHAHRRRPPPRFRPYMIIILVLSAGLLLIGLTMTIIGLWPSYSPSGGNPLQIVGPLMLGLGLVGLIGSIINICYKREQEKKQTIKSISDMRSSRMTLASQHSLHSQHSLAHPVTPTPSVHARPSKGILKASSTSTYNGGTARNSEYESDSGMANTHSFSTNRSYERDSNASDNSRNLDNIRVEMMPDPTAYRHGKPVDQSSTGSDQGVPPASMGASRGYRQPSSNKQARPTASKPTYNNQAYTPDARETDIDGDLSGGNQRRQMQSYGYDGYDAYDPSNVSGGGLGGAGALGGGGITGGGALGSPGGVLGSPYGTPQQAPPVVRQPSQPQYQPPQPQYQPPQPQPQQQRARWGSKSPKSPTGQANLSYTDEQQVSTVSAAYQQATHQYPSTPTSSSQLHYTSYAHSGGAAPTTPTNPSSSTEV